MCMKIFMDLNNVKEDSSPPTQKIIKLGADVLFLQKYWSIPDSQEQLYDFNVIVMIVTKFPNTSKTNEMLNTNPSGACLAGNLLLPTRCRRYKAASTPHTATASNATIAAIDARTGDMPSVLLSPVIIIFL